MRGSAPVQGEAGIDMLLDVVRHGIDMDVRAVALAGLVALAMLVLPRVSARLPASLVGIAAAAVTAGVLGWDVPTIGAIPQTLLLDNRLTFDLITPALATDLIASAISIAKFGAVDSLLCGAVAANMTGVRMDNRQELLAQGLGNLVIPFFGEVPATAAIALSIISVKSGGRTRLVSMFHSVALLLVALVAAPLIADVPPAALGGVLMVTAVRMSEWESIRFFAHRRLWHALAAMVVTLLATVALALTQAIVLGIGMSALLFLRQASPIVVSHERVDPDRLVEHLDVPASEALADVRVVYVTGPHFFGSVTAFLDALADVDGSDHLILSARGMPTLDLMGVEAIRDVVERQRHGGDVHLAGVQPAVLEALRRAGVLEDVGRGNVHWSADQAIRAIQRGSRVGGPAAACPPAAPTRNADVAASHRQM